MKRIAISLVLSSTLLAPSPALAAPVTTDRTHVYAIFVNIGWNSPNASDYYPGEFFDQLQTLTYKPDVVLANEVPKGDQPNTSRDTVGFKARLQSHVGGQWGARHSDTKGQVVFFRSDRFDPTGTITWREVTQGQHSGCTAPDGIGQDEIAVRLKPRNNIKDHAFVVSSVHFNKGATGACVGENVHKAKKQIESAWGTRRLTILGGDFNQRPDKSAGQAGRQELSPSCWYTDFYADNNCAGGIPAGWYYDVVRAKHFNGGTGLNAPICAHWTHTNSNSTDNETANECDSNKGRIDYIWARWENASGAPTRASGRVEGGSADRGYQDSPNRRYSDHRAVRALLRF